MLKRFLYSLLVVQLLFLTVLGADDYYKILGINKNYKYEKEIKSAYRKLSKKYHPDKNKNDKDAQQNFIKVGEAYDVLGDPDKKRQYDQMGHDAFVNNAQHGGPEGGPGGQPFHDPFDMFEKMFHGGGPGGGNPFGGNPFGGGGGQRRGPSLKVEQQLSLKQYYQGFDFQFALNLHDDCDHCHGTGSEDGKTKVCPDCKGSGIIIQIIRMGMMTQQIQQPCGRCRGQGHLIKNFCKVCNGAKVQQKLKDFKVYVPPGSPRNHVEVKAGQAEKNPNYEPGDVIIEFNELPLDNLGYRRRGNNLFRTEYISLNEALYGNWERTLDFLDPKKRINLKRSPNVTIYDGEIEILKGFGMPIPNKKNKFGDLYIDYKVIIPKGSHHLNDEL
ncbi:hypothetical protein TBLA_0B03490 [Henningerozyma blattae CBS 6284]|uniref:J domain-containing protein n=1 Tax=Henningerozyma blattae (strain ATCC 34711 / CBS 6284 / DSM 70876 / NBRC 10599 / NRRL Y-10934 / UCD 77-7) TaxID=1071380 RepID=I2GYI8_HENB6|nr:hypothetical protein TBLA_0B03490 [Tetrapisispora blattae CBS 6284]CCH59190.1 hypothetical protein TBLA_0B03490 [Tetrapisispora blattae CBS 6284]